MIGPLFDMFTGVIFIFSSARFLNMCKPRTGWLTSTGILWKWASKPTELTGDGECSLTWFHPIRNLQMKFIIFSGSPFKQAAFLPRQAAPYNQLLIQPL